MAALKKAGFDLLAYFCR